MSRLTKDEIQKYRQAGKIAAKVMKKAKKQIGRNKSLGIICDRLEKEIRSQGAEPAFPVNISVNQIAAHYTSPIDDDLKIPERSIIKLDLGAHIDGYISDHAVSFIVDSTKTMQHLKQTAELALEKAIEVVKPGIRPGDIGEVIEQTIKEEGLVPITDLNGHVIERWKLHTGTSIPNYKPTFGFLGPKLKEGQILAIEPFVTTEDGDGKVYDESYSYIFSQQGDKSNSADGKQVLEAIKGYRGLPFAIRWLEDIMPATRLYEAIKELLATNALQKYPMLVSKSQTLVAQAEHTVLITKSGCEVLTKV